MDLQAMLDRAVASQRASTMSNSPQLTLGQFLEKLESITDDPKDSLSVEFDFGTAVPTDFGSWRGAYNEVALGYRLTGYDTGDQKWPYVLLKDFVPTVRKAIGSSYTGWKGGDYTMTEDTPVWVSNDGNASSTGIVGVDVGSVVTLLTAKCDY